MSIQQIQNLKRFDYFIIKFNNLFKFQLISNLTY
jgi:hypothetical protein